MWGPGGSTPSCSSDTGELDARSSSPSSRSRRGTGPLSRADSLGRRAVVEGEGFGEGCMSSRRTHATRPPPPARLVQDDEREAMVADRVMRRLEKET